ncbi:MAG: helix-turn-helix domain-containing protein [Candidatus Levybacteria bacterium]|nr:helix-turn-helix domain-containing protein [Candidatus Levybacteria bacterium]
MIKVGERLSEERQRKGLTLEEIASATKIRKDFLVAIEKSDYKKLPSTAYAQGFVRNYAKFLKFNEKEILALFKREIDTNKELRVLPVGLSGKTDIPIQRTKIKRAAVLIFLILSILLGYIAFQYRYAIINPPLEVLNPIENAKISSNTLIVTGETEPSAAVFVNEESVSVDQDGKFRKEITVFPGKTTINISSVNRFGKRTVLNRHIEVE